MHTQPAHPARPGRTLRVQLEVSTDGADISYGDLVAKFVDLPGMLAVGIDMRTPSSASSPTLELVVDEADLVTQLEIALAWGCSTWDEFIELIDADITVNP